MSVKHLLGGAFIGFVSVLAVLHFTGEPLVDQAARLFPAIESETEAETEESTTEIETNAPEPISFADVLNPSSYYYDAVYWAAENNILRNTGTDLFEPDREMTRAEAVAFLYGMDGRPEITLVTAFDDLPEDELYANAISWAYSRGLTSGTGEHTFDPDASCSRAQFLAILYRYAGLPAPKKLATFTDLPTNVIYRLAISWAVDEKIVGGTSPETFSPNEPCLRGQAVTMLYKYMNLEEEIVTEEETVEDFSEGDRTEESIMEETEQTQPSADEA